MLSQYFYVAINIILPYGAQLFINLACSNLGEASIKLNIKHNFSTESSLILLSDFPTFQHCKKMQNMIRVCVNAEYDLCVCV